MAQNFLSDVKLGDNIYIRLGDATNGDFNIHHNGTNTFMDNETGNIYIRNYSDDKNIHFQTDDGSGNVTDYIVIHGQENIVKFQEHTRHLDNKQARFGTGSDLIIHHNSVNSFIQNSNGNLYIDNDADDADIYLRSDNGSGGKTAYFYLDGSAVNTRFVQNAKFSDGIKAVFGGGDDLQIYHDGTHSYVDGTTTGDLYIRSTNDDVVIQGADDVFIYTQGGEDAIIARGDGAVELYHNNVKQLETDTNGVEIINGLGVGRYPSPIYGIYQEFNATDANVDNKFAYFIDGNFSGADNTDGDREQGGIRIDIDSSADGDGNDEHRLYGVWSDVRFTGYSDLVRAGYFYAENNMVTGSEQTQETVGVYASAISDGTSSTAGTNNLKAVQGQASVQNAGYALSSYGGFFQGFLHQNRSIDTNQIVGVRGEVEVDSSNSITLGNARAVQAIIDIDNTTPTVTNSFLYYGGYEGDTSNISNKYGIYLLGSDNINRLDGITLFQGGTESAPSIARLGSTNTGIYFPGSKIGRAHV